MSYPFKVGQNNLATLQQETSTTTSTIAGLQLSPAAGLPLATTGTPILGTIVNDPQTGTIYSSALGTLVYSTATGKWYRRQSTSTTPSVAYEQVTPAIMCSSYSTAGNTHLTNTIQFYDFPTNNFNVGGGTISGSGGGINATYTNTWRWAPPQPGYYLVTCDLEWVSVPSVNTQLLTIFVYVSGTQTAYGTNGMSATGTTITRSSSVSQIVRLAATTSVISIGAQFNQSTPISQSTSGPANKITISYIGGLV